MSDSLAVAAIVGLFAIPTGLGIPAGTVLGREHGVGLWPLAALYLLASCGRAAVFEPCLRWAGRTTLTGERRQRARLVLDQQLARLGPARRAVEGPLAPLVVGFNVDPLAGRIAGALIGMPWHRAWLWALAADAIYFFTTAIPTLWLHHVTADDTLTVGLMTVPLLAGIVVWAVRFWRQIR